VATSGEADHPIARGTDLAGQRVPEMVFSLTQDELLRTDRNEVDADQRIEVILASGRKAWSCIQAGD